MAKIGQIIKGQSKMDSITTTNLGPQHHEKIGVEIGTGPKNFDKLNMSGGSNVRVVGKGGSDHE